MNQSTSTRVMNPAPRVTVFIPAFNVERYIAEAVDSVLQQTFTDFELLIIDDGSTDATPEIIARYQNDPRVWIVTQEKNLGRPTTRNAGLELARGELIAFLDADDRCLPYRLAHQIAYLDAHPKIDGVGTWMTTIDEHGQGPERPFYREPRACEDIMCGMLFICPLSQGSMLVRTRAISAYRYDPAFPIAEDYDLWARMIATCRFANLALALTQYRSHATQSSTAEIKLQDMLARKIEHRQISALGVSANDNDLIRHECLFRFDGRRPVLERTGAPLDIVYLRWARRWLEALCTGNTQRQVYPELTFSHTLASRWLFACRKAARNSPWRQVAVEFFGSSLLRVVARYGWHRLKTKLSATRLS